MPKQNMSEPIQFRSKANGDLMSGQAVWDRRMDTLITGEDTKLSDGDMVTLRDGFSLIVHHPEQRVGGVTVWQARMLPMKL
jgi:hypothetical protein